MLSYIFSFIVNIVFTILSRAGINLPIVEAVLPDADTPLKALAFIVVIAILPALCEEFIFRVVFMGTLAPISVGGAIIVSSFAFGMMHGTVQQIPFAFCLGIALAWAYKRTGNYRIPVLAHFINNLISCVFTLLADRLPEMLFSLISIVIVGAVFLCGIIAFVGFLLNKKPAPKNEIQPEVGAATGLGLALRAPMFWVFTAVYVGMTVVNTISFALMAG
jgi:hypothetical protein